MIEPENPVANINLGLLLGEQGRKQEAERVLRAALNADPNLAAAAYNLGLILAQDRIDESLVLCRRAYQLSPNESKYAYSLAYFLFQTGDSNGAIPILEHWVDRQVESPNFYLLLGEIFERQGETGKALNIYRKALANENLSYEDRVAFEAKIRIPL